MLSADKPELTGSIGHTHGNASRKMSITGTHIIGFKDGLERSIKARLGEVLACDRRPQAEGVNPVGEDHGVCPADVEGWRQAWSCSEDQCPAWPLLNRGLMGKLSRSLRGCITPPSLGQSTRQRQLQGGELTRWRDCHPLGQAMVAGWGWGDSWSHHGRSGSTDNRTEPEDRWPSRPAHSLSLLLATHDPKDSTASELRYQLEAKH